MALLRIFSNHQQIFGYWLLKISLASSNNFDLWKSSHIFITRLNIS